MSDPTYVVLRQHFLNNFDEFWIENMHGNRKISEYAPDGRTSETIFAIQGFSPGIQQGVVISLWVKSGNKSNGNKIFFRDDLTQARAQERRAALVESLGDKELLSHYKQANPSVENRFSFRPVVTSVGYSSWPLIADLSDIEPMLGLNDNRGQALHDISRETISERMKKYFDPSFPFEELTHLHDGLTSNAASFNARDTHKKLLKKSAFQTDNIWRFWFKPFDLRWAYVERNSNLWNRVRPELLAQAANGNQFLLVRRHAPKFPDGATIYFSRHISDQHALHTDAYFIPFHSEATPKRSKVPEQSRFALEPTTGDSKRAPNLSPSALSYLHRIDAKGGTPDSALWLHALAIGYTPKYLAENADGIRQDWPRIPLPDSKKALLNSAELGRQIASLLDTESEVSHITSGNLRTELKLISTISRANGGSLKDSELALTAGWGHAGKGGIVMPGKGSLVERAYSAAEQKAIAEGAKALGLSEKVALANLGGKACDVYLNGVACWSNIPIRVWEYTIGGYQVIKKWLSYREQPLLGRALTKDEVRYVQEMARRIAALLLLQPALDANYESIKEHTFPWPPRP